MKNSHKVVSSFILFVSRVQYIMCSVFTDKWMHLGLYTDEQQVRGKARTLLRPLMEQQRLVSIV